MNVERWLLGMILIAGLAGPSWAGDIQCNRILKYLSTGRSPSEVAETMVISEDDVIACKEEADAKKAEEGGDEKAADGAKE